MKSTAGLWIATWLAFSFQAANAQEPHRADIPSFVCADSSAVQAAQQVIETWRDGYNGGDPARVAALYSEDAYYLTQHFAAGVVHGRDAIKAYVKLGTDARYHIESIRVLAVGCSGDVMYVVTRYDSMNAGQAAFGVNLVVLRKSTQGWLIVAHEATVPDPATAVRQLDLPVTSQTQP